MASFDTTHATEPPDVDERLVAPETRYEICDGALVHVAPAGEPHGTRHSKVSALVEAHVAAEFDVATDMLTRTSETSDVAPDVSVFPRARDPRTGGRQLEHLAFEVVSTESLGHAGGKAQMLVRRGVRRVFAIDVERARALEWSPVLDTWSVLDTTAHLEDPALAVPLPIAALIGAARTDDVVARALILKRNPEIEAVRLQDHTRGVREGRVEGLRLGKADGLAEGIERGKADGLAEGIERGKADGLAEGIARGMTEALLGLLAARGFSLPAADRTRVLRERDVERMRRWIARAASCSTLAELFAAP